MRKLMFLLFIISTQTAFAGEVTKLFCEKTTESSCRIEQSIFAFITTEKSFNSLNHKFELYVDGLYESNMTLKEFLSSNYLKQTIELKKTNVNYQTKSNLLTLNSMNPGIISTQDHPLTCDRDVDWGCENWSENKYTNELMSRLENMCVF